MLDEQLHPFMIYLECPPFQLIRLARFWGLVLEFELSFRPIEDVESGVCGSD